MNAPKPLQCRTALPPSFRARHVAPLRMRGVRTYADTRYVVSLSSGVPSAVAAQRAIDRYGWQNVDLVFADTKREHRDNYRFLWELCQRWGTIHILMDGRTPVQVADDRQIIPNQKIAPCTYELKIRPLQDYVKVLQAKGYRVVMVIGMDTKDRAKGRLDAPIKNWGMLGVDVWYPLLDKPEEITPFDTVRSWGLEPPVTYSMGFKHANCLDEKDGGCWKMGHSDWRRIKTYFPEAFATRRDWEAEKRKDPRFTAHTIMKREHEIDGVRVTEPYSLAQMEQEHAAADTRQRRLFELEDDLQGCGVECGVNAEWSRPTPSDLSAVARQPQGVGVLPEETA